MQNVLLLFTRDMKTVLVTGLSLLEQNLIRTFRARTSIKVGGMLQFSSIIMVMHIQGLIISTTHQSPIWHQTSVIS